MSYTSSTVRVPAVTAMPTHIAIVMDGNGRWVIEQNLPCAACRTQQRHYEISLYAMSGGYRMSPGTMNGKWQKRRAVLDVPYGRSG